MINGLKIHSHFIGFRCIDLLDYKDFFGKKTDKSVTTSPYADDIKVDYLKCGKRWWLKTHGKYDDYAAIVDENGNINKDGRYVKEKHIYVRPILRLDIPLHLPVGYVLNVFNTSWVVLNDYTLISEQPIGSCPYSETYDNTYATSKIKDFIEKWLEPKLKDEEKEYEHLYV